MQLTYVFNQETRNDWTYKRDKKLKSYCIKQDLTWIEINQTGVFRAPGKELNFRLMWHAFMSEPMTKPNDDYQLANYQSVEIPTPEFMGLTYDGIKSRQKGGRSNAEKILGTFLDSRYKNYIKDISSPLAAKLSNSRISAHLAFGTLSTKEVYHAIANLKQKLKGSSDMNAKYLARNLNGFAQRLSWRSHFMQKLELDSTIEYKNIHTAYNDLRMKEDCNQEFLKSGVKVKQDTL